MKKSRKMFVDSTNVEARELALYIENKECFYKRCKDVVKMLSKKLKKGIYDSEKAIDAFYPIACDGAKSYCREFGGTWNVVFDVTSRYTASAFLEESCRELLEEEGE